MAQDSSPGDSSLSEVNSPSDTYEDDAANAHGDGPPAKRQKLSTAGSDAGSLTAGPAATGSSSSAAAASLLALSAGGDKKQPVAGDKATVAAGSSHNPPDDEQAQLLLLAGDGYDDDDLLSDVSSVSSAGLPAGYTQQHYGGDDGEHQAHQQREQHVTTCAWEGCNAGDLGDMDALVSHVSSQHIDAPAADAADGKKLHTCEWLGCRSKGNPHPSASALKAHVRSHTRERPFFCFLPECDRSFTRSDARMKHMRTIHLAEALRQQQPSTDVSGKQTEPEQPVKGRPKIILKMQGGGNLRRGTESSTANGDAATDTTAGDDDHSPDRAGTALSQYEELLAAWEHGPLFTAEERATPPDKLMRLLELRLRLAEEEGDALRRECDELEKEYRREWLEKEILLEQMIEAEVAWNDRRRAVLAGEVDVKVDGARAGTVPRENAEDEEAKPREFPIIQQGPTVRT